MKTTSERLAIRRTVGRQMTPVTIHLPKDVLEDLDEMAPMLGFSRAETLMRTYIGQGMRQDSERLEGSQAAAITESLRKHGVSDDVISDVIAEARLRVA